MLEMNFSCGGVAFFVKISPLAGVKNGEENKESDETRWFLVNSSSFLNIQSSVLNAKENFPNL